MQVFLTILLGIIACAIYDLIKQLFKRVSFCKRSNPKMIKMFPKTKSLKIRFYIWAFMVVASGSSFIVAEHNSELLVLLAVVFVLATLNLYFTFLYVAEKLRYLEEEFRKHNADDYLD